MARTCQHRQHRCSCGKDGHDAATGREGAYERLRTWRRQGREGEDMDMEAMAMAAQQGENTMDTARA